jgi:hypothetical protein
MKTFIPKTLFLFNNKIKITKLFILHVNKVKLTQYPTTRYKNKQLLHTLANNILVTAITFLVKKSNIFNLKYNPQFP